MPTPFPGMDPYLERPSLWPNVHSSLIIALRDDLAPKLRPRYYVAVEERTVRMGLEEVSFAARPDLSIVPREGRIAETQAVIYPTTVDVVTVEVPLLDELRQTYLELRDVASDKVVTVIEILSPANKAPGDGRRQYIQKRLAVLGSMTHLVEIDLLRAGEPMPVYGWGGRSDYRILVSNSARRPKADLLAFSMRGPIPAFRLPLLPGDPEPEVALTLLLHTLYDRAGYDLRVNYDTPPEPPLSEEDTTWATSLLRTARG